MNIKAVIKKYGETVYTVAEKMGVSQPSVSQIINGNPTVKKLEELARALGCSPAEFFDDWYENEGKDMANKPAEDKMGAAHVSGTEGKGAIDELPFENPGMSGADRSALGTLRSSKNGPETQAEQQGALVCPHCGRPFVVMVKG